MAGRKLEYLGEPTLGQVMRRPQWIAAFLLAMVVAAVFAWLGQWQMGNAIRDNVDELSATETVRPLEDLTEPIAGIPEIAAGAVVSVRGSFAPGDFALVEERMNQGDEAGDRRKGVWVVGHLIGQGEQPTSLAVAIGWAPTMSEAKRSIEYLDALPGDELSLEGRYLPAEAPEVPRRDADPRSMRTMVPAYLANTWDPAPNGAVYGGYLVLHDSADAPPLAAAGLEPIDSTAPSAPERVSWLNVFYGIEWAVFAAVALFLWYRLARDAWEKEHEMMLLVEAEAAAEAAAAATADTTAGSADTEAKS